MIQNGYGFIFVNIKGIKKTIKILAVIFAALLLLFGVVWLSLQHPEVQTVATRKAAKYLSERLKTTVEVGAVDIDFFKTVVLNDVLVKDLHDDTLLFAENVKADITLFSYNKAALDFGKLAMDSATIRLKKYRGEEDINLQFLIDEFTSKDTVPSEWKINVEEVEITNSRFYYHDENKPAAEYGVNFDDIALTGLNLHIDDIGLDKENVQARINSISFRDKSGFVLNNLQAIASFTDQKLQFRELQVKTPRSNLYTDISFNYDTPSDFKKFMSKVIIQSEFDESSFNMFDIAFFAPEIRGLNRQVTFSGNISGIINMLRGKNMSIFVERNTYFEGDVKMSGLPKIYETYIELDVKRLSTNKSDLDRIPLPPFDRRNFLKTPTNLALLGPITFKGEITGFINDFVSYGTVYTNLGNISSDLSLKFDEDGRSSYKGYISTQKFNAGRFFDAKDLGTVTLSANVNGRGFKKESLSMKMEGKIRELVFKNYRYSNIAVDGNIANRLFKGSLSVNDPNLAMDFKGEVNFQQQLPQFHFIANIHHARPARLNLAERDTSSLLAAQLYFNFSGNNLDNITGMVDVADFTYREKDKKYRFNKLLLTAGKSAAGKRLSLDSDIADAEINGTFSIEYLASSLKEFFKEMVSDDIRVKERDKPLPPQDFNFSLHIKNLTPVTELFAEDIKVSPGTRFNGSFNSLEKNLRVKGNSSSLVLQGKNFRNFFVDAATRDDVLELNVGSRQLMLSDSVWVDDFLVTTATRKDSISFGIKWDTDRKEKYSGDVKGYATLQDLSNVTVKLLPSEIYITDTLWTIDHRNEIKIDSSRITVNNLYLSTLNQSVLLQGSVSKNPQDLLNITFDNFKLANFNPLTIPKDVRLGGNISGTATVGSLYASPAITSHLKIKSFKFNKEEIGDGLLISSWNSKSEALLINARLFRDTLTTVHLTGDYYPYREKENLDLNVRVNKLRLKVFERFLDDVFSGVNGIASGNVALRGSLSKPQLRGKVTLQKAGFTVDYLKTSYSFSSDVIVEPTWFGMDNVTLFDERGNQSNVTGTIFHNNFRDWNLDLTLEPKNFLALNTIEADNPMYYGKAFISGVVNLSGYTNTLLIDIKARTEKGTQLNFPLGGAEEITRNTFINFVNKDTSQIAVNKDYEVNLEGIQMNFELDVTPDAEIQLIFDPQIGDVMRGTGSGHISMSINTLGNFNIYGEYIIEEGDYLFTFANVINKRFSVQKGGRVLFTGDIYKSTIDIEAVYNVRTSFAGLPVTDSAGAVRRVPVDLTLKLTNDLMQPDIAFDIGLPPGINRSVEAEVRSILANQEEANRQAFALLTLNRFVPPQEVGPQQAISAGQAGAASGSELLSNQLSNWLSQASKDFDLGFKYRPGDEATGDEYELSASTQIFNDRLTLEGNFGVTGQNTTSTTDNASNLVGEGKIEYKISDDGRFRIFAFNRADNTNLQIGSTTPYTQGVGAFYRLEFESFKELYKKFKRKITGDKPPET